jgi:hypothetical protein
LEIFQTQNFINLIGGLIILFFLAWQVIEKAFGNVSWIKAYKEKREKTEREKREKEISALVKEIIIPPMLKEIEHINDRQNEKLDNLVKSSNDTMRLELLRIYFKYQPCKKIPQWAKESAAHLYEDYTAQDGNSFIGSLWKEMETWEVIPGGDLNNLS